jgi:hypothetical protein
MVDNFGGVEGNRLSAAITKTRYNKCGGKIIFSPKAHIIFYAIILS